MSKRANRQQQRQQGRAARPQGGNYLKAIEAAFERGELRPGLHYVDIGHDDWCDYLNGRGPCNCEPDITIAPLELARTGEAG